MNKTKTRIFFGQRMLGVSDDQSKGFQDKSRRVFLVMREKVKKYVAVV